LVGGLGVDPNYAQGMDYDEENNVLYWAAYTTAPELRIIDITTGASALIGTFTQGEVDSFAIAAGGSVADLPWLTEDPAAGVVPPDGGSLDVTLTFDATGLTWGDYFGSLRITSPEEATKTVPVQLRILALPEDGFVEGIVSTLEICNVNPTPAANKEVKFFQNDTLLYTIYTNSAGFYKTLIPSGTYDLEVEIDGYETQTIESVVVTAGQTATADLNLRLLAPCLKASPSALEKWLLPNTTGTQTLTLTNYGAAEGVFELVELPFTGLMADQLILDPSFEAYTPNPYWDEYSEAYGTPLCTVDDCGVGGGTGPHSGDVWNWLGGSNTGDVGYVSQEVVIGPGTAILTFWAEQKNCGSGGASDYMTLEIDGEELWRTNALDSACGTVGYRQIEIDVSAFADGGSHEIMFYSASVSLTNFFVDDVELQNEAGGDVEWLSEDPVAEVVPAGESVEVTITYDATGLAVGDYNAILRVKNAPSPAISIPVTLHVMDQVPLLYIYLPLIIK